MDAARVPLWAHTEGREMNVAASRAATVSAVG